MTNGFSVGESEADETILILHQDDVCLMLWSEFQQWMPPPALFNEATGHIGQGGDHRRWRFGRQRGQTSELAVKIPGFWWFLGGDTRIQETLRSLADCGHRCEHSLSIRRTITPWIRQSPPRNENSCRFSMAQAFNAQADHLGCLADAHELLVRHLIAEK
jgi:hypothetical protein